MSQVKLQVPMDKDVRDGLDVRAKELGFDSAQAYIRFWAKAQADGRNYYLGEAEQMTPKMEAIAKEAEKEIANGDTFGPFKSAKEAVNFLNNNTPESLGLNNDD